MKKVAFWGLLFPLLLGVSCSDKDNPKLPDPIISLDPIEIEFKSSGGETKVKLTTNSDWSISPTTPLPAWISLDHISGTTSQEITIIARANDDTEKKETKITFVNEDNKDVTLTISQVAMKRELAWSPLRFSSFDKVDFTLGANNVERIYSFTTREMFVNPSANPAINQKLFLGNLINRQFESNTDVSEYTGYTFLPITIIALSVAEPSQTITPSKIEHDAYAKKILDRRPLPNAKFISDNGTVVYSSHRELNLIGKGNLGVNLDEIVSGKSYQEQEMVKKNGIIYSFSHTAFTLSMDLQEHIVEEALNKADFPENSISYISTVSYGRIGLLLIESDYGVVTVRALVNKLLQNKSAQLSQEETTILNELSAYHLYFDSSQKLKITPGKADVIEAYGTQVSEDLLNVYPFQFTVTDYFVPGVVDMFFKITLP